MVNTRTQKNGSGQLGCSHSTLNLFEVFFQVALRDGSAEILAEIRNDKHLTAITAIPHINPSNGMTMTITWSFGSSSLPHNFQGNIAKDMEKRNLDVFLTSELCLQQLKYHTWPNLLAQLYPNDGRFRRIGCWMARIGSTAAFWWPGTCPYSEVEMDSDQAISHWIPGLSRLSHYIAVKS